MRKLLLLLFLCSLATNALAKVEIWKCPWTTNKNAFYKIDTSIPDIQFRSWGEWNSWPENFKYVYIKDHSVHMINNLKMENGNEGRTATYDLVTKQKIDYPSYHTDGDRINAKPTKQCEVIEYTR